MKTFSLLMVDKAPIEEFFLERKGKTDILSGN